MFGLGDFHFTQKKLNNDVFYNQNGNGIPGHHEGAALYLAGVGFDMAIKRVPFQEGAVQSISKSL
jgi:hypothetical protein